MRLLTIKPLLLTLLIVTASGSLMIIHAGSDSEIGSLDINSRETGDGAGCFFSIADNDAESYVFLDRDGYGWIRLNTKLEKLNPTNEFIMWPSKKGDTLHIVYKSDKIQVNLNIEVTTGCKESEDNCSVVYEGTLIILTNGKESIVTVQGFCGC